MKQPDTTPEALLIDGIVSSAIDCGIEIKEDERKYYGADDALKLVEIMSNTVKIGVLKTDILKTELRFAQGAFLAVVNLCLIFLFLYIHR